MALGKKTGGRQKGAANKKTREIADKAAQEGVTPLEYMLEVMRAPMPPELAVLIEELKAEKRVDSEVLSRLVSWHAMRCEAAKGAAPYVHPKLQTNTIQGAGGGPVEAKLTIEFVN